MGAKRRRGRPRSRSAANAVVVTIVVLLSTSVFITTGHSDGYRPGFVYRIGATLMLDGAPYRFIGVNNYGLTGCHTGKPASEEDADAFFAALPPRSVTRVWAFEEWGINSVEQTVRLAEQHDQKVVLVLADSGGHCGVPIHDAAWYEQGFKGPYLDWTARLATEFSDSPAVAFWELVNEPGAGADDLSPDAIKQFYDAAAAHIKQFDSSHLVSTGALAPFQSFQQGEAGYQNAHSGPDIDLVSVHEYDYPHSNGQTLVSPHFDVARAAAQALDKPVYVGEVGVSLADGCMTASDRAGVLRKKFDGYFAGGASGVLYWVVQGPPNNPGTVCDSQYGNGDPMLGGAVMEMIGRYWQESQ
jgi:mannan endo-1,4-beta-mannosidase